MMILDATKRAEQRALLESELDAVGIRLNRDPPYAISVVYLFQLTAQEHLLKTEESRRHENHLPVTTKESR